VTRITIRPFQSNDEAAIREITYRTGFHGEDLSGRNYFDDRQLFFLIFIYYYTRFEQDHCFVAETRDNPSTVIGFICGSPDSKKHTGKFKKEIPWRVGLRVLTYTSWRYPRTIGTLIGLNYQRQALLNLNYTKQTFSEYPGHLHINVLPEFQGLGIGSSLIKAFEADMQEMEVRGIHLTTSNKNFKAVPFYKKMGFGIIFQSQIVRHPHFNDLRFLIFAKTLTNCQ